MSDAFGLLKRGDVVGEFEVIEPLAEGGMGAVFVARQKSTGRKRALKVLHPRLVADAALRERFLAEAMVSAEIGGEHPVDVVGCGVDPQRNIPWIAMELLEGETLERRVRRAPLSPSECAALFRELGDVLDRAHRKGIVHRDLKPENLFLVSAPTNERGFVTKVLDFGIAAFVSQGRTAATATRAMGTPLWMAPEQYETHGKIRPSTDVWSLGLIAFFALTAREFWLSAQSDRATVAALMAEILTRPIPSASARLREIHEQAALDDAATIPATRVQSAPLPPGFDAWFARCVAREVSERFATGVEACAALVALLDVGRASAAGRGEIDKTIPVAPPQLVQADAPPRADARREPESNATLYGAVALLVVGGFSVLAWKAVSPPARSAAATRDSAPAPVTAAPSTNTVTTSPSVTRSAPAPIERIHVGRLVIEHTQTLAVRPGITRSALDARLQAERLRRRAQSGEDFRALARAHSDEPQARSTGGDLGFIVRGQTIPAFERAAFALAVGEVSEVVSSPYGFYVIKRFE